MAGVNCKKVHNNYLTKKALYNTGDLMLEETEHKLNKEWNEVKTGDWQRMLEVLFGTYREYAEIHEDQ